ncbi:hypothetical protein PF002_g766 [Phytophthora fragariae]|uniref:Uncharacterized protein n=1 Tax=Phytophthora fragariae TaxID=53985 RepID=A0A6A4AEY5_9STRA|nr:hypothetical protein PF009_g665 [Phytophthora fragariae]KAE9257719.1 hypothetical protein PF002_g766 [Phytophthora fragariae]
MTPSRRSSTFELPSKHPFIVKFDSGRVLALLPPGWQDMSMIGVVECRCPLLKERKAIASPVLQPTSGESVSLQPRRLCVGGSKNNKRHHEKEKQDEEQWIAGSR